MNEIYYTPTEIFINYIMTGDEIHVKKNLLDFFKTEIIIKNAEFDAVVDDTIKKMIASDGSRANEFRYFNFACTLGTSLVQYCQKQIEALDLKVSLIDFYLYKAISDINFPVAIAYYLNEKVDLTDYECFRELTKCDFDLGLIDYWLETEQPCVPNHILNWATTLFLECEDRPKFQFCSIDEYITKLSLDLDRRFEEFLSEFNISEHEKNFYFDLIQYELDLINLKLIAQIDLGLTERKYYDEDMTTVAKLLSQARLEVDSDSKMPATSNIILIKH